MAAICRGAGLACLLIVVTGAPALANDLGRETLAPGDGWAASGSGTTGGAAADADHVHTVTNRQELLAALDNRSSAAKIIYVQGTIDLNVDDANMPLACGDYQRNGYTLEAYLAAYDPAVWGRIPPEGPLEDARKASRGAQQERVKVPIGSHTTIVGLDKQARIRGGWFDIRGTRNRAVTNIIIRNLRFEDTYDCFPAWEPTDGEEGNWNAELDSISLRYAQNVWIDHNTFADLETSDADAPAYFGRLYQRHDGMLDITDASDLVTVTWNRFLSHDKVMLIGASDNPAPVSDGGKLRVTLHHNLFQDVNQRAPRVRFGQVHVYNNLYKIERAWRYGGSWTAGIESAIYAENNFFRVDAGVTLDEIVVVSKGKALYESGTLLDGPADKNAFSVVDAYNATHDPDLTANVGWKPDLFLQVEPTRKVLSRVQAHTGPLDWSDD